MQKNGKLEHHQEDYAQTPDMVRTCVWRMEEDLITKVALRWTPPGKRKPGSRTDTRAGTDEPGERPNILPGTEWNGGCSLRPYVP